MSKQPESLSIDLLPYLSEGFCNRCKELLETRLQNLNLNNHGKLDVDLASNKSEDFCSTGSLSCWPHEKIYASPSSGTSSRNPVGGRVSTESTVNNDFSKLFVNGSNESVATDDRNLGLSDEQKRMSQVGRKKDFVCKERIDGKEVNVLKGLELHTRVFNDEEQKKIVEYVFSLQRMGQSGKLSDRTYSEPNKWMRGKGRITIQFGCCYNYVMDKSGNPPGILRDEEVDPIPSLLKSMIKRLVKWHILPSTCIPNSCIVNIYDEGDCIPPHIDHHDFLRPFCTVSFLTESNILFGSNLKIVAPGEFDGSASIPLPVGSVLVLKGNGADVAKHCVPAVLGKRISITFRKMDDSKLPFRFLPDPELQGIQPLSSSPLVNKSPIQQVPNLQNSHHQNRQSNNASEVFGETDFPPLGASINKPRSKKT
ncbi:hypothetical protein AQUCO_22100001v1 [Aquilegia coerulea]|uniref:Fe2OG dioxygenase domain-containing protein n=1 Tax=Aquilegia coerulea TaxID=218851 RepID=A0A2G5C0M3_AQUCA|nr:hypothetical protein AQUCO_22100001v1 [Aquilegia coerulea]